MATADPMRVVIAMPWGERLGGAESMLWALLRHLDRSHIEPHVIALQPGPFEREIAELGVATTVISAGRLREARKSIGTVRAVARLLERERPDLILNWSPKTQIFGGAAARWAGMSDRVVWWQHGIPDGHWVDRVATAIPASAVGCSSRAAAAAQRRLWPHRETFVVHPGIDPPSPVPARDLENLRVQLAIPSDRLVVGMVGRLQPWKAQDRLLRALRVLRDEGHDVHGLIVGSDAYELSPAYATHLEVLVHSLGLSDAVTMTGQVDDVVPHVQLMDVLVNASEGEPFGIVLLEAMAVGAPVVAVASGGPLEIIDPGRSGMLADSSDPATLAAVLSGLLAAPGLRAQLAEGGRGTAARFSATRMADEMQDHLEALVEAVA